MNLTSDLIRSYVASGLHPSSVHSWYGKHQPSSDLLSLLADGIGRAFLKRQIDFTIASGLLNQLMVHVGFDSAPQRFWQYYIAFEDSETSRNPDEHARSAVQKVANAAAA